MTSPIVFDRVLIRLLASIAIDIDMCIRLRIFIYRRVQWHAEISQLGGFYVHGMSNELFIIRLEDLFTLMIWQDGLAVIEERMYRPKQMSRHLGINRTSTVIMPYRLSQNDLSTPRLTCGYFRREGQLKDLIVLGSAIGRLFLLLILCNFFRLC